jgi:hypothetical protein
MKESKTKFFKYERGKDYYCVLSLDPTTKETVYHEVLVPIGTTDNIVRIFLNEAERAVEKRGTNG